VYLFQPFQKRVVESTRAAERSRVDSLVVIILTGDQRNAEFVGPANERLLVGA
jgi:hypothetical protein